MLTGLTVVVEVVVYAHPDQELVEELVYVLVDVYTALAGSEPQVVVVAVAMAARPEKTIAEARILNYLLSLWWIFWEN